MNDVLDEIDRAILTCLTQDARVSLKVLSARVGLTSPSTAERVKRLEERGVIQGYGARVNLAALGYSLQALVRVRPLPGLLQKVDKYIQAMPECIESDKVTGEDCFVMRLVVRDIAQLDTLLDGLAEYAQCNTSVVKSSPVKGVCHRCEFPGGGAAHLSGLPDGATCSLAKRSASEGVAKQCL